MQAQQSKISENIIQDMSNMPQNSDIKLPQLHNQKSRETQQNIWKSSEHNYSKIPKKIRDHKQSNINLKKNLETNTDCQNLHQIEQYGLQSSKNMQQENINPQQKSSSDIKWKQTLDCVTRYYNDEQFQKKKEMQKFAQFQLFSPKQISDFKNLDNFQNILKQKQPKDQIQTEQSTYLEGLISPKIGVNIRRKIKPSQMRYQNSTSIPNLQSKLYIEDEKTVRGPGYYEPSYSLTKKHQPEIEFNSDNKLKKQRSKTKLMHYESTQPIKKIQKEQIKSFLQDFISKNNQNQERSIASLSQDIYKTLNAKNSENQNQYVFKSLQPQQQQLDQWKVEIPGPGHYNINQQEIQNQINSNRSKVRDFDKQTSKNNTLHLKPWSYMQQNL